ncbi:MAG TPA: hypothetical protein VH164_09850 [Ktedonobacteraceae bacterium]|nr:hypothetical protein [Ktedonobacteraceae bacterium]
MSRDTIPIFAPDVALKTLDFQDLLVTLGVPDTAASCYLVDGYLYGCHFIP